MQLGILFSGLWKRVSEKLIFNQIKFNTKVYASAFHKTLFNLSISSILTRVYEVPTVKEWHQEHKSQVEGGCARKAHMFNQNSTQRRTQEWSQEVGWRPHSWQWRKKILEIIWTRKDVTQNVFLSPDLCCTLKYLLNKFKVNFNQ